MSVSVLAFVERANKLHELGAKKESHILFLITLIYYYRFYFEVSGLVSRFLSGLTCLFSHTVIPLSLQQAYFINEETNAKKEVICVTPHCLSLYLLA